MALVLAQGTAWPDVRARAVAAVPEAFDNGRPRNLIGGSWQAVGTPQGVRTPVDGSVLAELLRVDAETALGAVRAAAAAHRDWSAAPLADRKQAVRTAVDALSQQRDLL